MTNKLTEAFTSLDTRLSTPSPRPPLPRPKHPCPSPPPSHAHFIARLPKTSKKAEFVSSFNCHVILFEWRQEHILQELRQRF